MSVQLQEILETPLLSPQAASWREQNRLNPREYDSWLDAQLHSLTASEMHGEFKDIIFPLIRTKSASTLRNMWKTINEVCLKIICILADFNFTCRTINASARKISTLFGAWMRVC